MLILNLKVCHITKSFYLVISERVSVDTWEVVFARLIMFTLGFVAANGVMNFDISVRI